MGAVPPDDQDRPATRRDLELSRQASEAVLRKDIAELRVETVERIAELRVETAKEFQQTNQRIARLGAETAREFQKTNQRIANQTRILIGAVASLVLMQVAVIGLVARAG